MLTRKLEFWLASATGIVYFAALCLGDRRELRDAILESVGTLVVG